MIITVFDAVFKIDSNRFYSQNNQTINEQFMLEYYFYLHSSHLHFFIHINTNKKFVEIVLLLHKNLNVQSMKLKEMFTLYV